MFRIIALLALAIGAVAALADGPQAVLSTDGAVYTVSDESNTELRIVRRIGTQRSTYLVPTTGDDGIESDANLAWDAANKTLYVMWHRSGDRTDQIFLARFYSDGTWSDPLLVATGAQVQRVGLEMVMTRAKIDSTHSATLIHAAWWSMGAQPVAEYALVAFENGEHTSTSISDLKTLSGISSDSLELEAMNEVLHPPLAIERSGTMGVDVVFGAPNSTAVTRVTLEPKLRADARLWKPGRKGGSLTPKAGLMSANGEPVQALLSKGRIVLYTPDNKFRFVIYDRGKWSSEHMIALDENLTSQELVHELRKAVEQLDDVEPAQTIIE